MPDSCLGCHEDLVKGFPANRHHKATESCGTCHVNAKAHSESAEPKDVKTGGADVCLGCHKNHAGRMRGGHPRNNVACTDCHSTHAKQDMADRCGRCHSATVAEFRKPYRHPQGSVTCADCHYPHGRTLNNALAATSANEPGCQKCHATQRGPFTFEHAPVRQEGCASCHEPHGSVNPRMLNRAQVHLQCLECHSATTAVSSQPGGTPPAFHNLRDPRYRNCTTCHVKVHGSHVSRYLLR